MKGLLPRTWTRKQEQELVQLVTQDAPPSIDALATKFKRTPAAIKKKLERLGINVVASKLEITAQLDIPKELPSLEAVLKIVAAAMDKASQPGLGRIELQRLDTIATLFKTYAQGLERYVGYRKIEAKLLELDKKYAKLTGKKSQGS